MNNFNNGGVATQTEPITFDALTSKQKERYNYLHPIFKTDTALLVTYIEGRGRNSWLNVDKKITAQQQSNYEDQRYFDVLSDNFTIGEIYTNADITGIVAEVRRDLGLPAYFTRLKSNCENDLFSLFIVQDVYENNVVDDKLVKTHIGYRPVFRLKTDD